MKLRPFDIDQDFDSIKDWINDERSHAMWCANNVDYPVTREEFGELMQNVAVRCGDKPYVATDDNGNVEGFFCYSTDSDTKEGMLKFVVVDPEVRGKGIAGKMLDLIVRYGFDITNVDAVHLNVFTENPRARRCYEKAGFVERNTTPEAYLYKDEKWGRCNMIIRK